MRNLLSLLTLLGATVPAAAFNPQPDPPRVVLVSIGHEQIARVGLINTGSSTCSVTLRMLDVDGDVIAARTQSVAPGDEATLAVAGAELVPEGATHVLLRASVTRADDANLAPPDPCVSSFAIRDASSGATNFATGRFARLSSTRAITPLVTPNANQRAQLAMVNAGEGTCQATLSFRAPGNRTLASRTVTLAPGASTVLDIAGGSTLWGQAVLAENPATPGTPPDPCMVSYAIYNASTGSTHVGGALTAVAP